MERCILPVFKNEAESNKEKHETCLEGRGNNRTKIQRHVYQGGAAVEGIREVKDFAKSLDKGRQRKVGILRSR